MEVSALYTEVLLAFANPHTNLPTDGIAQIAQLHDQLALDPAGATLEALRRQAVLLEVAESSLWARSQLAHLKEAYRADYTRLALATHEALLKTLSAIVLLEKQNAQTTPRISA